MNVTHRGAHIHHQIILVYIDILTSTIPNDRFNIRQARLNIVVETFTSTRHRSLLDTFYHAPTSERNLPPSHTKQPQRATHTVLIKISNCDPPHRNHLPPLPTNRAKKLTELSTPT